MSRSHRPSRFRRLLQIGAFARKESMDILRQPRLLGVLVLGPFLILLAFGLGYDAAPSPYRTLFVSAQGGPMLDEVPKYVENFGPFLKYEGTSTDEAAARERLLKGDLDVVVVLPSNPLDQVLHGERAKVQILHNRIDPIELTAIDFASKLAVDQINTQVLARIVTAGQDQARPLSAELQAATQAASALSTATEAGDTQAAKQALAGLDSGLSVLGRALTSSQELVAEVSAVAPDQALGGSTTGLSDALASAQQQVGQMKTELADGVVDASTVTQARNVSAAMDQINKGFQTFTGVEADVLVSPFTSEVESAAPSSTTITDFYAPAAVVLLVQQFGVAFAALTFVRERQIGILDVFRAAPLDAGDTVIGKYLSYLILGGLVAAVLTFMVVWVMDVPLAGTISSVAVALGLTLFASIGLGLIISLLSRTDSQAVQYTLLVLLASLFFSGFFLSVDQLSYPSRILSWLLPATYGMRLLRDTMLRGRTLDTSVVIALSAYGLLALAAVLAGTRRRLSVLR